MSEHQETDLEKKAEINIISRREAIKRMAMNGAVIAVAVFAGIATAQQSDASYSSFYSSHSYSSKPWYSSYKDVPPKDSNSSSGSYNSLVLK